MIPRISNPKSSKSLLELRSFLKEQGYSGEFELSHSEKLLHSRDNSIYQLQPIAIAYPKTRSDLNIIVKAINSKGFSHLSLTIKGGGTSTNGQCLNETIILDTTKYLNKILSINKDEKWVEVEPGVILDQLNNYLSKEGFQFDPSIAPSDRASIGGMTATDACGVGSQSYGKMSDHIIEQTILLSNGDEFTVSNQKIATIESQLNEKYITPLKNLYQKNIDHLAKSIPPLPRKISLYNLKDCFNLSNDTVNLNYLIAGSEGTLGISKKIKLKVKEKSEPLIMVLFQFQSFHHTLNHISPILDWNPYGIEILDQNILKHAKGTASFESVKHIIDEKSNSMLMVLFKNNENKSEETKINNLIETFYENTNNGIVAINKLTVADDINNIFKLRKKGVGIIGNIDSHKKGIAFIEDSIVPIQNCYMYITELIELLNQYKVSYGFYGHADSGCIHLRPALDLKNTQDRSILLDLYHKNIELLKKYNGIFCGEHGVGIRSKLLESTFDNPFLELLSDIKTILDPLNKLNPGKITVSKKAPHIQLIDYKNHFFFIKTKRNSKKYN